ncbi:ComEC/Rec2 family competence protein [uncultured Gimesia sp.]|uniref:ComEC/Rec2 family competence protein n=1 Tax=uncultured Gimesia sp. TaxID=1678688 RepID=UPI00261B6180|nr:ComEC/Rec2 family competence protein [uncultured Gimesia sp.]
MSESPTLINAAAIKPDLVLKTSERSPALSILICFSLGILFDSWVQPELWYWILFSIMLVICWSVSFRLRWNASSTMLLLVLALCLGGMRHHEFWLSHSHNHITRLLNGHDQLDKPDELIRITGVINTKPLIQVSAKDEQLNPDQPTQRTSFILECKEVIQETTKTSVSGKIRVTVTDPLNPTPHIQNTRFSIGDTIDLVGHLKLFSIPDNPNDFDLQTHYRKQQLDAFLTVKSSRAIKVVSKTGVIALNAVRQQIHDFMAQLIINNTSESTQSIGLALLLGDRSELNPELRKKFSQSGLIHFLAISGLHIGFFTIFVWSICHLLNTPRTVAVILLICAIIFYLSIIEIRPPILRAASFCSLITLGLINWRTISTLNLMCITAIIILMINPTDLFDIGTQLSFLAVSSILWTIQQEFYQNPFQQDWVPLKWRILSSDPVLQSPLQWFMIRYVRLLYSIFLVTFFIWVVTAPLVLYHFNLLAPIGLLINTLIFPFLFLILLLGYLLIFVGSVIPFSAAFFGYCFDCSLCALLWIVETASEIPFAHFELPSPPIWWLVLYYLLILSAIIPIQFSTLLSGNSILRKLRLAIIPIWIILGILIPLFTTRSSSLQCTFIAVNHGVSILIETPQGQSILYDAGSMSPVKNTYPKIKNTLLARGIRRVDLLLISHADRDHFNAASKLVADQYVRELAFPQSFLDQKQYGTLLLCNTAEQNHVPVKIIGRGDYIYLDPEVSIEVLHPDFSKKYETDNAASLTILLTFKGRRILLTGDLEGEGLEKLLTETVIDPVDVLLSPHHGSLSANTAELAHWANPDYVIVSCGKKIANSKLQKIYSSETQIFTTYKHGAITCRIDHKGKLEVIPFRYKE